MRAPTPTGDPYSMSVTPLVDTGAMTACQLSLQLLDVSSPAPAAAGTSMVARAGTADPWLIDETTKSLGRQGIAAARAAMASAPHPAERLKSAALHDRLAMAA